MARDTPDTGGRRKAREVLFIATPGASRRTPALVAVAALRGGLRNVANAIRLARLFAGDDPPGPAHPRTAILDLKLAPKGADA